MRKGIFIFSDYNKLSFGAATLFWDVAQYVIRKNGRFSVSIPGGTTPKKMLNILGSEYRDKICWEKVHIFWTDERCVPPNHKKSNFGLAHMEMLRKINIPEKNIHKIYGELEPVKSAKKYEEDLKTYFKNQGYTGFDLIYLGVGDDGHTASLFSGSFALDEKDRLCVATYNYTEEDYRVSLTLPVINSSTIIVFLVSGKKKSNIVKSILLDKDFILFPASLIEPKKGCLIWLLDIEAASKLTIEKLKKRGYGIDFIPKEKSLCSINYEMCYT